LKDTIPIGVRVQKHLLDRAKTVDPNFNLSKFVRRALIEKYGDVEDEIDLLIKSKEVNYE